MIVHSKILYGKSYRKVLKLAKTLRFLFYEFLNSRYFDVSEYSNKLRYFDVSEYSNKLRYFDVSEMI